MKVLMLNGSPHKNGCTDRALREIAAELAQAGLAGRKAGRRLHGLRRVRQNGQMRL